MRGHFWAPHLIELEEGNGCPRGASAWRSGRATCRSTSWRRATCPRARVVPGRGGRSPSGPPSSHPWRGTARLLHVHRVLGQHVARLLWGWSVRRVRVRGRCRPLSLEPLDSLRARGSALPISLEGPGQRIGQIGPAEIDAPGHSLARCGNVMRPGTLTTTQFSGTSRTTTEPRADPACPRRS